MKLIQKFSSLAKAKEAEALLRSKGILATVTGENVAQTGMVAQGLLVMGPPAEVGLWTTIDNQFDDAIQILANPEKEAHVQLSENEMTEIEIGAQKMMSGWINSAFNVIACIVLGGILISFIAYVIYNVMSQH